jgi:hypothetical protein
MELRAIAGQALKDLDLRPITKVRDNIDQAKPGAASRAATLTLLCHAPATPAWLPISQTPTLLAQGQEG